MTREEDRQRLQRVKDKVDALKHEGLDHQHPKFKEWRKEAKAVLRVLYGDESPILKRFEELPFRRRGDRMWMEDHDVEGKERGDFFKEDLERSRAVLEEALEGSYLLGEEEDGIGEEEFISSVKGGRLQEEGHRVADRSIPGVLAKGVDERRGELKVEELLKGLEKDRKDLERVQSTLEEAIEEIQFTGKEEKKGKEKEIEGLLQKLEKDIRDPSVDLENVQRTMKELLKVRSKEDLLQRLLLETKGSKVPWRKIKGLMRVIWEIDRQLLVDILPDLLED